MNWKLVLIIEELRMIFNRLFCRFVLTFKRDYYTVLNKQDVNIGQCKIHISRDKPLTNKKGGSKK